MIPIAVHNKSQFLNIQGLQQKISLKDGLPTVH